MTEPVCVCGVRVWCLCVCARARVRVCACVRVCVHMCLFSLFLISNHLFGYFWRMIVTTIYRDSPGIMYSITDDLIGKAVFSENYLS